MRPRNDTSPPPRLSAERHPGLNREADNPPGWPGTALAVRETLPGLTPADPAAGLGAGEHKPGLPRSSVHFLFTRIQLLSVLHTTTRPHTCPHTCPRGHMWKFPSEGRLLRNALARRLPLSAVARLLSHAAVQRAVLRGPRHGPPPARPAPGRRQSCPDQPGGGFSSPSEFLVPHEALKL